MEILLVLIDAVLLGIYLALLAFVLGVIFVLYKFYKKINWFIKPEIVPLSGLEKC